MKPYKIEPLSNQHKCLKTIKKPPDVGGLNFWYSVLSEYRTNYLEDFKKLPL